MKMVKIITESWKNIWVSLKKLTPQSWTSTKMLKRYFANQIGINKQIPPPTT